MASNRDTVTGSRGFLGPLALDGAKGGFQCWTVGDRVLAARHDVRVAYGSQVVLHRSVRQAQRRTLGRAMQPTDKSNEDMLRRIPHRRDLGLLAVVAEPTLPGAVRAPC